MDRRIIGAYRNGNYDVFIFDDGTKIRSNDLEPMPCQSPDECFIADFPDSMDVTITHRCNAGCEMCYAGCTQSGENGDILSAGWINFLHPYTEMAIGGGNIFEHPDLIPFLEKLESKKIIANITVNQRHFLENYDLICDLVNRKLVYGVGVSIIFPTEELLEKMSALPHAVAHCILGVISMDALRKMYDRDIRLLLLGYKTTGRGADYISAHDSVLHARMKSVNESIGEILHRFKVVAFDNMALNQLDVRSHVDNDTWNRFYMGDDGINGKTTSSTMFIDMVDRVFAINSMSEVTHPIEDHDTPGSMFRSLQGR